jgi:hypothetical protein
MIEDIAHLRVELATALANNEILSGNVETLRALSLQLAVQVEELNVQLKIVRTESESLGLRSARDAQSAIDNTRHEYQREIEALRSALSSEEEALRETVAMWENREAAAERRLLALEREKDRTIGSLTHEIEVLRQSIQFQIQSAASTKRPQCSPKRNFPVPTLGRRSGGTQDESDVTNIISIVVSLPTSDTNNLRFSSNPAVVGGGAFHSEIIADPLLLELVSAPQKTQDSQRWVFRIPSGEQIAISVQLL